MGNINLIGLELILLLFLCVWSCDSSAFVIGKYFGKRKILPKVSPNKPWEGTFSGIIGSIIVICLFYNFTPYISKELDFLIIKEFLSIFDILLF